MIAAPPSVTRQQSRACRGEEIILDPSTSSTVSLEGYGACGCSSDHSRADTATVANCSGVVPNSCICRAAIIATDEIGWINPYGSSYADHSARLTSLPLSER